MIDLSRHIEYLLLSRNEVCIQQLGVFRAKNMASRWVEDEHIFLPPYRTVEFHEEGDSSDNTFLQTLATKYKITMQEADIMRAEFVERIQQELEDNGTADLGSIGVFIRESVDGQMLFIPCEAGITTPTLYGLDATHLAPLPMKIIVQQQEAARKEEAIVRSDNKYFVIRIPKRVVHFATAAAAALVLFFTVSGPVVHSLSGDKPQTANASGLIPGSALVADSAESAITTETTAAEETKGIEKGESVESVDILETFENIEKTDNEAPQPVPTTTRSYAIVLVSSIPMQKAELYAEQMRERGIEAEARDFGKMVRVIIPGFPSTEAAQQRINQLKQLGDEFQCVWTLPL